ncbi:MAG: NAD(P)/FAD-dependent oxidoreductase [Micropepsaceae bacterium]
MSKSVLVIGGGMVGAACALRLQAAGLQVAIVDPGDKRRGASFGNAGHIATEQVEPLASWPTIFGFPWRLFAFGGALDFRAADAGLWLPWSLRFAAESGAKKFARGTVALGSLQAKALEAWQRLAALAEAPDLVRAEGHNVVWMSADGARRGIAAWAKANTGPTRFREMTRDELDIYRGAMPAAPVAGLRFTGSGQFKEPQAARDSVLAALRARGGVEVRGSAVDLRVYDGGVAVTLDTGEVRHADEVLIAAGAWSARVMKLVGLSPPLIAERGYSVHSAAHAWPSDLPPTLFEERSLIVTRFSSGLRATSFLELGDPDPPGDDRKWRWLETQLRELGIAFAEAPDRWRGPRPTLPDFLPAIGRMQAHPRVLYAFGHQHLGMTLSAVTAEAVEALATGAAPPVDLAPFRVERFG